MLSFSSTFLNLALRNRRIVLVICAALCLTFSLGLVAEAAPGDTDSSFGAGGIALTPVGTSTDVAQAIAIQPDGKLVAAGWTVNSTYDFALVRYNTDGTPDTTFGTGGKVVTPIGSLVDQAYAIAIQPDGKIIAAGLSSNSTYDFALARYNPNGTLDTSFGTGGKVVTTINDNDGVMGLAIQPDGKIIAAGYTYGGDYDFALARYNADGTLDTSFGTNGNGIVTTPIGDNSDIAYAVALQLDGRIVVAGSSRVNFVADFALVRYNSNGTLDASFGAGGKVVTLISDDPDEAQAIALQADGKIVVAGYSGDALNVDFALARYNTNGALDSTFGSGGKATTPLGNSIDVATGVIVQPNGKIVAAGKSSANASGTNFDYALARYNNNGALDTTFGAGGKVVTPISASTDIAQGVALQADGKIVAAGYSGSGTNGNFALVRYLGDAPINTAAPGNLIISEFRLRGTAGANDEFIELYNNTDNNLAVSSADGSNGWSIVAADGITRYTIPFNTHIPARGHYLIANSNGYSLNGYPSGNGMTATPDGTYVTEIPDDSGIALYRTSNSANFAAGNLLDAAGFGSNAAPYAEGSALPLTGATNSEYSVVRRMSSTTGAVMDTNNNLSDFIIVSTDGSIGGALRRLGAPGPENRLSPINKTAAQIAPALIDPLCGGYGSYNAAMNTSSGCQNKVIDSTPEPSVGATYSLYIRRSFTNNTGAPITRLRFRIVDITTLPASAGNADLRALTSPDGTANVSNGMGTIPLTIKGTTLETPPDQTNGGGYNSTLSAGYITLNAPLAVGATTAVQFKLARVQGGNFRFFINVEALP